MVANKNSSHVAFMPCLSAGVTMFRRILIGALRSLVPIAAAAGAKTSVVGE
jgi:hypothetical protein